MEVPKKAFPILLTLNKLNTHFRKLYCYPSQEKLISLLKKFTSISISRRQLNYDLAAIVKSGYIRRIRRHRRSKLHGTEFRSTLYEITLKGYNLLLRSGVITFEIFKRVKNMIAYALKKQVRPTPRIGAQSELTPLVTIIGDLVGNVV